MLTNKNDGTRNFVIDSIAVIVEYRGVLDYAATLLARFGGDMISLIDADDDDEEEVSSVYR